MEENAETADLEQRGELGNLQQRQLGDVVDKTLDLGRCSLGCERASKGRDQTKMETDMSFATNPQPRSGGTAGAQQQAMLPACSEKGHVCE